MNTTDWQTRVRELRRRLGMTQRQLEERLGMDPVHGIVVVSRWENGHSSPDRRYQYDLVELERETIPPAR